MRIFHCRPGTKYEGEHKLYPSVEEWKEANPNSILRRWARDDFRDYKPGDWVEPDDGWILQLLNMRKAFDRSNYERYWFKFPMCTSACYVKRDGTLKFAKLYGGYTPLDAYSVSGKAKNIRSYKDKNLIQFAAYVTAGVPIIKAYILTSHSNLGTKQQLMNGVMRYMAHPIVKEEIKNQLEPFLKQFREEPTFSDEAMIEYVKDFMINVKKGSLTQLTSIIPLLKLLGKLPEDYNSTPKKKFDNIEDIPYEEQKPPI